MVQQPNEPVVLPRPGSEIEALLKRYRNLGGVPFSGNESIIQTQAWMRSVDRILKVSS